MNKVRHNFVVEFLYSLCYGFLKLLVLLTYIVLAIVFLFFLPLAIIIEISESIGKDINKHNYYRESL